MKGQKSKIVVLACAILAGYWITSNSTALDANAAKSTQTNESIRQKEEAIKQAKKEKENLQKSMTDLKKIKSELESQKENLAQYVVKLDGELDTIQANIEDLRQQITVKEEEITNTEAELANALEVEEDQRESMIRRMKMMYEQGGEAYFADMLLKAEDYSDFLNRADFMERIVVYDKAQWRQFIEIREYVELCKEELELEKMLLDQAKQNEELEEKNMKALIRQKENDIVAYQSDINNKEKAIKEYENEIATQNAEISALEKAIADEKKKLLSENKKVQTYDGGTFCFPLESYKRVSDDYGNRIHPILKVKQFHNGVDLAANSGTAIYAAYDGTVVAATYSGTMGNYVMINHGDDLYTIYMHASALYVSKGDVVTKGQKIAAVGSTGRSTGAHLHFSVRKNNEYTSPWNYISKP